MSTIEEILAVPRFSDLNLINNKADLTRKVDTIEISETPDMSGYLPQNTLLLTTAMAFKDNPLGLCDLIRALNNLPSAGIAIKLGRFISELDPKVIEVADELGFPIIRIPVTRTLGEVSHQLLSYIWDNHTELMYFALDIQRKFSNMMMKGATVNSLINHLSSLIKRPIFILNPFGEIQATSRGFKIDDLLKQEIFQELKDDIRKVQSLGKTESIVKTSRTGQQLLVTIYPVGSHHFFPHMLVILKSDQFPYPFSQLAIEQAISVLSYTIYKDRLLMINEGAAKKEFFTKLTDKNFDVDPEIDNWIDYGKPFNIIKSNSYRAVVTEMLIPTKYDFHSEEIEELMFEWFFTEAQKYANNTVSFPLSDKRRVGLLFQKPEKDIQGMLMGIHETIKNNLGISVSFGIGNPVSDIHLFRFSFYEAIESLQRAQGKDNSPLYLYENKGIRSLVEQVEADDIRYFCTTVLKDLAYPDNENDIELRRTLSTYLNNQCRITETAEELFIHRNTVKYRITKCAQLFGKAIDDPDLSIQLRVALLLSMESEE